MPLMTRLTPFAFAMLVGGSLAQAQSMPAADEPSAAAPADACPILLQGAEAALERGRAGIAARAWKDAAAVLRESSASFLKVAAGCPALAPQANRQGEKAVAELKLAEGQMSHHSECQPRLDKALDLDIRAASVKSASGDPAEMERLLGESEALWREAASLCLSPHREKAERSLAATVRARAANAELLSAGPACDGAWKNATTLVDLAKAAWKDKRWDDAGMLYSKAALAWEGAADKCSGNRQQLAQRKIEQTQTDAHNAEFCGPLWDAATEQSQRVKAAGTSAALAERDQLSIRAEVAWRDAAAQCRGAPQNLARSNADALARERGAPLPPNAMAQYGRKLPVAGSAAAVAPASVPVAGAAGATAQVASLAVTPPLPTRPAPRDEPARPVVVAPPPAKPDTRSEPVAAKPAAAPAPAEPTVIVAGDTTYRGAFVADQAAAGAVSGSGSVEWANGERYTGSLVGGRKQGRGRFDWVGGQWYEGEWQDDRATGQGVIQFVGGNRYEGGVVDGEPQGRGTLIFASGDRYTGDFVRGVFHGQGTYAWKNGNRYEGAWNLGRKHGPGRLMWAVGGGWEGEFRDDQKTDAGRDITVAAAPR